jgi:hypothetical protein
MVAGSTLLVWHAYDPPSSTLAFWMMSELTVVSALFVSTDTPPRVDV